MSAANKLFQAASGGAGGESVYVEDVFSTYVYDGIDSAALTIDNGIALADEGGMIWFKRRNGTDNNCIYDTERGAGKVIFPDTTGVQLTNTGANKVEFRYAGATGFQTGQSYGGSENGAGKEIVSWTFREQAGFLSIVTWTGDGTSNRQIAHNLGSVPGCIIVKRLNDAANWAVWHRGFNSASTIGGAFLNLTNAFGNEALFSNNSSSFSDSYFLVSSSSNRETNGFLDTYVAYVFAHDDQQFGDNSDESIIKCGSFTEPSSGSVSINLGFEPQFVLAKPSSTSGDWYLFDTMRGMPVSPATARLSANSGAAEVVATSASGPWPLPTATGFDWKSGFVGNETWIYIAIRRPMKTPEAGTEVFAVDTEGSAGSLPGYRSGFPVDMIIRPETGGGSFPSAARLIQGSQINVNSTAAATAYSSLSSFDYMNGFSAVTGTASNRIGYMFKRATGFMDVVVANASNPAVANPHNLGVVPELIIIRRTVYTGNNWSVSTNHTSTTMTSKYLNSTSVSGQGLNTAYTANYNLLGAQPTATNFTMINQSDGPFVCYLFATLAGVSKVGSYTGTGANLNVDCGFSAGARFVLITRVDAAGDWYTYDSVIQGIVSGNDPYILLNSTAAQVTNTDYIDPLNAGFTVTSSASSTINVSSGTYIFLAIA